MVKRPKLKRNDASASGRGEDLIEEADQVGWREFLDRHIDGIERGYDPLAHGKEVIGRKARTVTYPDREQHAKAPHKERAIAGKCRPCSIAQFVDAVAGEITCLAQDFEAREPVMADLEGNGHGVGRELFEAFRQNVGLASNGAAVVV